jgi:hypothetical protein
MDEHLERELGKYLKKAIKIVNAHFADERPRSASPKDLVRALQELVNQKIDLGKKPALKREFDFAISAYIVKTLDDSDLITRKKSG